MARTSFPLSATEVLLMNSLSALGDTGVNEALKKSGNSIVNGNITGSLTYQGTWNATTNTPTLASGVGTLGYYYYVSVAGSTNIDGITDWQVGDMLLFNGTAWQKVDNTDAVTSVAGKTGAVTLNLDDLTDVAITGVASGEFLRYNGTNFVNTTIGASDIPSGIDATKIGNGDVTNTELSYIASATGTTGTGNIVFSATPTFTGGMLFSDLIGSVSTNSVDGSDSKAITIAGGGAYGPTRGSGIAVIGNEYAAIGGDLELMAGDSAISGAIKFYVGDGGGGALLAGKIERSTKLTTFYGGLTTVGAIDAQSTLTVASTLTVGGQATATAVGMEIGNTAGGTPFIDFKSSGVDYNARIINGTSTTLSFLGASAGYFFDATINSIYSIVATTATATLSTITEGITTAGNLVTSAYVADGYTAGLTWSSTDNNASKPKAGIFVRTTGLGAKMIFGMSSMYATGITNSIIFNESGGIETTSKIQIGSTSPTASAGSALTVNSSATTGAAGSASIILQGANNTERIKIYSAGGAGTGGPLFNLFSFRGSISSPTATQLGDIISGFSGGGYKATGYSGNNYAFIQYATENWTDTATGCYTAFFTVPNGSTSLTGRLLINHDGAVTLGSSFGTGVGALYAGATQVTSLQCDSIVNDTGLASGTYTPTLTNTTNISASTAYECQYMRVGNTVTVSGKVDVDPTSASVATALGISLPVASNLGTAQDLGGVGASVQFVGKSAGIYADTTNDRATMEWINDANVANQSLFFTFTYQVI